jgi:hypothetical protein
MDFVISDDQSREKVISWLKRLPVNERRYKAKIVAVRKARSLQQNKYQWFVFELIARELGTTKEAIHDFFAELYLREEVEIAGHVYQRTRGTSELSTAEHSQFMEDVRIWSAVEEGIIVPLPEEVILDDPYFE